MLTPFLGNLIQGSKTGHLYLRYLELAKINDKSSSAIGPFIWKLMSNF